MARLQPCLIQPGTGASWLVETWLRPKPLTHQVHAASEWKKRHGFQHKDGCFKQLKTFFFYFAGNGGLRDTTMHIPPSNMY